MGYASAYQSLRQVFPQVNIWILKAVSDDHHDDHNEAASVVLYHILPYLLSDSTTQSRTKSSPPIGSNLEYLISLYHQDGTLFYDSPASIPLVIDRGHDVSTPTTTTTTNLVSNGNELTNAGPGDTEPGGAFSSPTHGCSVDHLKEIIHDAKTNKETLVALMDSVTNLMKEVELEEQDAEKSELEAARGGLDALEKVKEFKKMLKHAKEKNEMHAGEVNGEKSNFETEAKELENRLLNLSEERNKSVAVLDEMRETLKIRLAAALERKKAAEQEKKAKEDSALKALAEHEAIMKKVVQESKLLQQEADQNSKLREFLMDRGQVVDSLQGEISVICQDVKLLKEKLDNRVSITKSVTSSLTSSCGSSMRSLVLENAEPLNEMMLETSSKNKSPKKKKHLPL